MSADKVIVTNLGALRAKYGAKGAKAITAAVNDLIVADRKRGLTTVLVPLDDVVKDASNLRQNKKAIDGVYTALVPHYLMLLGAIDVIPHQALKNPLFSPPNGDTDEFVFADLPYACDTPFSADIQDFTGPSRVVSRLPDVTGGKDPAYLVNLLKTAARWRSRPRATYQDYFGISAEVWRRSTRKRS